MTPATPHPDWNEEQQRLKQTVEQVGLEIERKKQPSDAGVNAGVNAQIDAQNASQIAGLEAMRDEAYFARLDLTINAKPRTVYIGKQNFRSPNISVYSWRDGDLNGFSSLVYRPATPRMSYENDGREIELDLHLRRRLDVSATALNRITDDADFRGGSNQVLDADTLLRQRLETRDSLQPRDIITTIQVEQNELIRAPHDGAVIINGVAGSGKTMIAYHRLSVLLYERNNTGIRAERVLFIGPNRSFLEFMRGLLPSLEIGAIRQRTLADWMLNALKLESPITDFMLEQFTSLTVPREWKKQYWLDAKLFGDLRWNAVLQRYAQRLMRSLHFEGVALSFAAPELSLEATTPVSIPFSKEELQAWFSELQALPVSNARKREIFEERWDTALRTRFSEYARALGSNPSNTERQKAFRRLNAEVSRRTAQLYPSVGLSDYRALLSDPDLLEEFAPEFSPSEREQLQKTLPATRTQLDILELAGFYLLNVHAGMMTSESLDHVVIDEAQDVSPLQLQILAKAAHGSITILGDIAQSIHGYRGIGAWHQAESALTGISPSVTRADVLRSYRSTPAITRFNNEILRRTFKNAAVFAEVFQRSDEPVKLQFCPNEDQMLEVTLKDLRQWRDANKRSAVITRTAQQAVEIARNLERHGITAQVLTEGATPQADHVLVSSVALCKGMEFDAVAVLYADATNYQQVQYEGRLLYVACSRAMNSLSVYGVGKPTRYLPSGSS